MPRSDSCGSTTSSVPGASATLLVPLRKVNTTRHFPSFDGPSAGRTGSSKDYVVWRLKPRQRATVPIPDGDSSRNAAIRPRLPHPNGTFSTSLSAKFSTGAHRRYVMPADVSM